MYLYLDVNVFIEKLLTLVSPDLLSLSLSLFRPVITWISPLINDTLYLMVG